MKICILTSSYPNQGEMAAGGAPWWQLDFIKSLKRRGHQVFVVTGKYPGGDFSESPASVYWFEGKSEEAQGLTNINPHSLSGMIRLGRFILRSFWSYFRTVRKQKPDHVLVCWAVPFGLFAVFTKIFLGLPYSVYSLGSDVWKRGEYPFGVSILKLVFRKADLIMADGFGLADIIQEISRRECHFASTVRSLDTNNFYSIADNQKKNKFFFVGRYDRDKGVDLLLEAWKLLVEEEKDVYLYIFGVGSLESQMRDFIKNNQLADYVFLGGYAKEEDIVSYMRAVDCVVIPSRFDSIPLVFSEALQNNCPMVVTDVGDTGSLVRKYNLGFVAQSDNAKDLKDKLLEFVRGKNKTNYQAGINQAKEIFNIERSVNLFLDNITYEDFRNRH